MKGNQKNYKDTLKSVLNNMNKGIRMDLNTHNITKLATQLANIYNPEKLKIARPYLTPTPSLNLALVP